MRCYYPAMRAYLPVFLVLLAVFAAGCIIYIAWELSAGDSADRGANQSDSQDKREDP